MLNIIRLLVITSVALAGVIAAGTALSKAPETLAADMSRTAGNFLAALDGQSRSRLEAGFDSPERSRWNYLPHGAGQPVGISTGELGADNRENGFALLESGLSDQGLAKAREIVALDDHLHSLTGRDYSSLHYWFTVFGDPNNGLPWGWRFEGHHLSLNFTVTARSVAATPLFFGSNPAEVTEGERRGLRILAAEFDLALTLLNSLDSGQRRKAIVSDKTYGDIVYGMSQNELPFGREGIAGRELTARQREALEHLIEEYVGNLNPALAANYLERYRQAGLEDVYFAWAGGTAGGQACYYRVHAPGFVIEFDNSQLSAAGNDYNHFHTVWRDLHADFGEDLLREHYEKSPHHQHN